MTAHTPQTGYEHWLPDDGDAGNCGRCHQPVTWDPLTERYTVTRRAPRIAVHATPRRPIFTGGNDSRYAARRAWSVWMHGERLPGWYVVDGESPTPFRTVIRNGVMVTSWHLGIAPGDLARLTIARLDAEQASHVP